MSRKRQVRHKDWDDVDGEKQGVNSRNKARHIERNDQLFVGRMVWMAERW